MRCATIPSRWLKIENRLDAGFWARVTAKLIRDNIESADATDEQVRAAIKEVKAEATPGA